MLGQAVQSITTSIVREGTVDYGTGDWRVYGVIQGQMRVVDAMVESRLRLDGPGARSLWRIMIMEKVWVLGLGRLVEGLELERGRPSRTFGYWRCVVCDRGEVPKGAQQVCGGDGVPKGAHQVCGGDGVPKGAQQVCGGDGVPEGAQQVCGGGRAPGEVLQGCGDGAADEWSSRGCGGGVAAARGPLGTAQPMVDELRPIRVGRSFDTLAVFLTPKQVDAPS